MKYTKFKDWIKTNFKYYFYITRDGTWLIQQTNPFPFIERWRVEDPEGNYIATFRVKQDAIDYLGHLVPIKERT